MEQQDEGSSEDEFLDYDENTASQETLRQPQPLPQSGTDYSAFQDINGSPSLPQYPEDDQATSQDINEGPSLQYQEVDQDERQLSIPDDAEGSAASFATSFTSSFTSGHQPRSKRHRDSRSPSSSLQHPKKHHAAQPEHPSRGRKKDHRNNKAGSSGKGKAKASSLDTEEDGNGEEADKTWNAAHERWEYWDQKYQSKRYWDGEQWQWLD